jgi:hypothetical protein
MFEMTQLNDNTVVINDCAFRYDAYSGCYVNSSPKLTPEELDRKEELDLRVQEVRAQRELERIDPDFADQVPIPVQYVSVKL